MSNANYLNTSSCMDDFFSFILMAHVGFMLRNLGNKWCGIYFWLFSQLQLGCRSRGRVSRGVGWFRLGMAYLSGQFPWPCPGSVRTEEHGSLTQCSSVVSLHPLVAGRLQELSIVYPHENQRSSRKEAAFLLWKGGQIGSGAPGWGRN